MNISELHLRNFKRFTDLKINLSEHAPKLVLLIGANGSGKSSIFDALEYLSGRSKGVRDYYLSYFKKDRNEDVSVSCLLGGGYSVQRSNQQMTTCAPDLNLRNAFYGRSSLRTVPSYRPDRVVLLICRPTPTARSVQ